MQKFSFQHIPCGPLANESERLAFERLRTKLQGYAKDGRWISGRDVTLIDYDAVIESGSKPRIDTAAYSSPAVQQNKIIEPSDDIYVLAATFYHVLYDPEPYRFEDLFDKARGLNWDGIDRDLPLVRHFFQKATDPDPQKRPNYRN